MDNVSPPRCQQSNLCRIRPAEVFLLRRRQSTNLRFWPNAIASCGAIYRENMPQAAAKPCSHPGCGVLVRDGSSRCKNHPTVNRFADKNRGSRHERGYGTDWDKQRERILRRDHGLCQVCAAAGRVTLAREVDHRVPKAEGGTGDDSNLQSICRACHGTKTQAEAKRGIERWAR